MERKKIDFSVLPSAIQYMIENNQTAASIIDELVENKGENSTLSLLIILDDMNIRGVQISNLYKMCGQNIDKFYEKIITMTDEDINELNYKSYAVCPFKAIYEGGAEDRIINPDKYMFTDEERNDLRNKKSKNQAREMLDKSVIKQNENFFPTIKAKDAISIIENQGFKCGYKIEYKNKDKKKATYRVFYNSLGDIIYTNSLENPDVFLWGESKLNIVRQTDNKKIFNVGCNSYRNIKNIVGYNIELKENPFETYEKILENNEKNITDIKKEYYNNNLFPIIKSLNGINYKEKYHDYNGVVISEIYNLFAFPKTYELLDEGLKKIYANLLSYSEEKAYDELLYQLNTDKGIDIAQKLQKDLSIELDKEKLLEAKDRFCQKHNKYFNIQKSKFFSHFIVEDPLDKELKERISRILDTKKETVEA